MLSVTSTNHLGDGAAHSGFTEWTVKLSADLLAALSDTVWAAGGSPFTNHCPRITPHHVASVELGRGVRSWRQRVFQLKHERHSAATGGGDSVPRGKVEGELGGAARRGRGGTRHSLPP